MKNPALLSLLATLVAGLNACASGAKDGATSEVSTGKIFLVVPPAPGESWTSPGRPSRDGQVVIGFSGPMPFNATSVYRWGLDGGTRGKVTYLRPPGIDPAGDLNIFAAGISNDSSTILGTAVRGMENGLFLWNRSDGMSDLGTVRGTGVALLKVDFNADGGAVACTSDDHAFRWTRASGRQSLGQLSGDSGNEAVAISGDGRVLFGNSSLIATRTRVFRWTEDGGMVALDLVGGQTSCQILGHHISDDGAVLFGKCNSPGVSSSHTLFRWTEAGGVEAIPTPASLPYVEPFFVTSDGAVAVGSLQFRAPPLDPTATTSAIFRWTASTGLVTLSPSEGLKDCTFPKTMSDDGSIVVAGCSGPNRAGGPVKWDRNGVPTMLLPLPEAPDTIIESMSGDGRIVAGSGSPAGAPPDATSTAVVWDGSSPEARLATDFLLDQGVIIPSDLTVQLQTADVSRDGHTLVGTGVGADGQRFGWLAHF